MRPQKKIFCLVKVLITSMKKYKINIIIRIKKRIINLFMNLRFESKNCLKIIFLKFHDKNQTVY